MQTKALLHQRRRLRLHLSRAVDNRRVLLTDWGSCSIRLNWWKWIKLIFWCRRRTTTGPTSSSTQQPAQSIPATAMPQAPQYAIPPYLPYMTAFPQQPQAPNVSQQDPNSTQESIIAQQMAIQQTMHQMYLQYWNFYNASMGATAGYQPMAFLPPTANVDQATYQNPQPAAAVQVQAQPQPPPQPQVQPQQNDDENENRDWLEIFYTLSRLIVLLSLVYFYSSPIRCSIVIFVMILYYLWVLPFLGPTQRWF